MDILSSNHRSQRTRESVLFAYCVTGAGALLLSVGLQCEVKMQKVLVAVVLLIAGLAGAGPASSNLEALDDIGRLRRFASTNAITQFFQTNSLSFEVPALKRHADRYFWVVSYPYSGMDTIDLYCFRGSPNGWTVQMLYYAFRPTDRHINIVEEERQFVVKNGGKQLLTFTAEP